MEQHPVPQHIAAFEFKLFGNLTVRQFIALAIPMSAATLIFFSNLPAILRFPLSFLFAVLGVIAALVPIQGRPLDKWLFVFLKAILSPTQRMWIKEPQIPEFLQVVAAPPVTTKEAPQPITTQSKARLAAYLRSLPRGKVTSLDVKEQVALQELEFGEFWQAPPPGQLPAPIIWPSQTISGKPFYAEISLPQVTAVTPPTLAQTPSAPEEIRQVPHQFEEGLAESLPPLETTQKPTPQPAVKIAPHAKPYALGGLEKKLTEVSATAGPLDLTTTISPLKLASEINFSQEVVIPIKTQGLVKLVSGVGQTRVRKLHFAPPENFDLTKLPIRGEKRFEISEELKQRFGAEENQAIPPPATQPPPPKEKPVSPKPVSPKVLKQKTPLLTHIIKQIHPIPKPTVSLKNIPDVFLKPPKKEEVDTKVSIKGKRLSNVPFPTDVLNQAKILPLTHKPNILSGLVTGSDNSPLEGAILIVRDQNGIPVRALKTNKLGQFLSATPLPNGQYVVEVESEVTTFEPLTINLSGQVVAPLAIKAKG